MSQNNIVTLNHGNATLKGVLYQPEGKPTKLPALLVVHDAMGLGPLYMKKARDLADSGYVALAVDMYGDGFYSDVPEDAGNHFVAYHQNPTLMRERMLAWLAKLASLPEVDAERIAAIGYCFGGQCVLELARAGANLKSVTSFHGLLTTDAPATPGSIRGTVAVYTGSKDPYAPRDQVVALPEEMKAAGADLHLTEFSGAYHAFTNPSPPRGVDAGMQYDALCDRVSWAATMALLDHTLSG